MYPYGMPPRRVASHLCLQDRQVQAKAKQQEPSHHTQLFCSTAIRLSVHDWVGDSEFQNGFL